RLSHLTLPPPERGRLGGGRFLFSIVANKRKLETRTRPPPRRFASSSPFQGEESLHAIAPQLYEPWCAPLRGLAGVTSLFLVAMLFFIGTAAAAPQRIVSMNLCTDQMALLLAGPERIVSISFLGADPAESSLAGLARGIP